MQDMHADSVMEDMTVDKAKASINGGCGAARKALLRVIREMAMYQVAYPSSAILHANEDCFVGEPPSHHDITSPAGSSRPLPAMLRFAHKWALL